MGEAVPVIGVIGANGFIGSRVVECFHLGSLATVRPVVRTMSSLARSCRFRLDVRVADGFDTIALRKAINGCDIVLHAIAGDHRTILGTLEPLYAACRAAGVKRLIYLSSASVHGQAPVPGTDEESPLSERQAIPYNNAKVQAEQKLRRLREAGKVETVILRPGIVFGPRSNWTGGLADELLNGQACLVGADADAGICNSIYIDNLVHAIHLAATAKDADGHAFLVADRETVTWHDLYQPIVEALGMEMAQVPRVPFPPQPLAWRDPFGWARSSTTARAIVSSLPRPLRSGLQAASRSLRTRPERSPWENPPRPAPAATLEKALLHSCRYKLPWHKAREKLGYEPVVSFSEGCRRSLGWLAFAGYPVVTPALQHRHRGDDEAPRHRETEAAGTL